TSAAIATLLALHYSVVSAADLEPVQRIARLYASVHRPEMAPGTYRVFTRNLIFYTGVLQAELTQPEAALAFLREPQPVLCVMSQDDLEVLEQQHGVDVRKLGSVQYFNPAGVRLRTLLWPDPENDLETVVLVTNQ